MSQQVPMYSEAHGMRMIQYLTAASIDNAVNDPPLAHAAFPVRLPHHLACKAVAEPSRARELKLRVWHSSA